MNEVIEKPGNETRTESESTVSRREIMKRLRKEGMSDIAIGAAFGISRQRVHFLIGPKQEPKRLRVSKLDARLIDLPAFLKAWREEHNLTIARAARVCGVSTIVWWNWEMNRTGCSLPMLVVRYLTLLAEKGEVSRNNH